jgi:hypothetical protein
MQLPTQNGASSTNLLKKSVNSPNTHNSQDLAHSILSIPLPGQKSGGSKKESHALTTLFDVYEFSQRKTTKLLPLTEIVRQEKGQRGLDEMKKKSADIIKIE